MQSTLELYGVEPSHFNEMTAKEQSLEKIRLAKKRINKLFEIHYSKRDWQEIKKLQEAILHHEYLLNEE